MRLIIHAGSPKTGTSKLQQHLSETRTELLESNRTLYPNAGRNFANESFDRHVGLRFAFRDPEADPDGLETDVGIDGPVARKNYREEFIREFDSEIALTNPEIVIVSDEALFRFSEPQLWKSIREFFESRFDEILVIVYLRRPDEYITSWYSQCVKMGEKMPLGDFTTQACDEGNQRLVKLDTIATAFSKESLSVRPYIPAGRSGHDIVADFAEAAACTLGTATSELRNTSLSAFGCEILRNINCAYEEGGRPEVFRRIASQKFPGEPAQLNRNQIESVHSAFYAEHQEIVKRYMGGDSRKLYQYDDMLQAPIKHQEENIEEMAKEVASALVELRRFHFNQSARQPEPITTRPASHRFLDRIKAIACKTRT
ncbi:hypothetical protein EY643_01730 [Halioglobus maricola]|uniref:Sulfotransferase family protein n=1 Tax=Halioglobus maricola TaxID=2601894 RepID=A0A5P9NG09_9GAMM|nr:hypothetical protein [Halioglobus maricola]QFU74476.1 hypothetical protein EY643_01730 [Halioglobus maricola]